MRPALFALLLLEPALAQEAPPDREGVEFFEKKIRPVLVEKCYRCHSRTAEKLKAGLYLDSREGTLKGGDTGPALVPGDPEKSLLIKAIRWNDEDLQMPPKNKLPKEAIADFEAWVKRGAPDPRAGDAARPAAKGIDLEKGRERWAFQPLRPVAPPAVKDAAWPKTPVDRFVLARLEEAGLSPSPAADPRRLVRRATFDLTGLPPTPEEVEAFVREPDLGKLLDRLLASPAYGERWARFWLDNARFAESHGFEQDYDRENAYHYRDFVIRALNQDMPYDQFVRWQVAGDELAPEEPLAWMATGFLGAGAFPTQLTEVEFEPARYDELDNMTSTVGSAMLGLSVGCARCHDHKYDPIPSRDFYRLAATFTTAIRTHVEFDLDPPATKRALSEWEKKHAPVAAALGKYEKEELTGRFEKWRAATPKAPAEREKALAQYKKQDAEWTKLNKAVQDSLARKPKLTSVLATTEGLKPLKHHADDRGFPHFYKETHFLARGDVNKKQGVAAQGFLQVLSRGPEERWVAPPTPGSRTPRRRAALARWLTDVEAGGGHLLARVIVNRLWHHHFGRGIVSTPNDFGAQGEPPTHPELLDWLAGELVREGWRLKSMHRLLMTSAAYLQGSSFDPEKAKRDPDNRLLWRWGLRRLEAEAIRDSMLAVSGLLDRRMYGPGTLDEGMARRSVYFFVKRSKLIPWMMLFDAPEPLVPMGRRPTTTIAPQALLFLNSPHVRRYAEGLARRAGGVREAYRAALGRDPSPEEERRAEASGLPLADLCQVLMAASEFIYVE